MASRVVGGGLGLHGHGLRDRQLRGPLDAEGEPTWVVIACRRYLCTTCDAVVLVVPRGVAPRRHYGYAAIAMAFALWTLSGMSVAAVRARVCAWRSPGATRWSTLARWASATDTLFGIGEDEPARAAQIAIGHAPPGARHGPRSAQAHAGGNAMS